MIYNNISTLIITKLALTIRIVDILTGFIYNYYNSISVN